MRITTEQCNEIIAAVERDGETCPCGELPEWWSDRISVTPQGCWRWLPVKTGAGYGRVRSQTASDGSHLAHRLAYETFRGPIPKGLELDHLCRVTLCVHPCHLEPVTHQENIRRGFAIRTHCPYGHAYDEANTYRTSSGHRQCRTCHVTKERERKRRARAQARAERDASA